MVEAVGWHRWASWQSLLYPSPVIKVAGRMSFEKPMEQDGDSVLVEEGNTAPREIASGYSVLRSLRTRARSRNNMHENSGDPHGP